MSYPIKVGATDQIAIFRAYNDDGTANSGIDSTTTDLSISIFRIGLTAVSIGSITDKAADDTAHSDGAMRNVAGNIYTIDIPDTSVATQCGCIIVKGSYSGGIIEGVPHPLVGYDVTAEAVGALPSGHSPSVFTPLPMEVI